jgi:hypothetical protein
MTLNDNIRLHSDMDLTKLCGGLRQVCDEYFYLCVSDQKLYFKNQSTVIQNGKIHVKLHAVKEFASIEGLVLLKGTLGESHNLSSYASKELLHFDPVKFNSVCTKPPRLGKQNQDIEYLPTDNDGISESDLINMTNSSEMELTSTENTQTEIVSEIESTPKQQNACCHSFDTAEQRISKSVSIRMRNLCSQI